MNRWRILVGLAGMLFLVGCANVQSDIEPAGSKASRGLDGAAGKFFSVDLERKCFSLLKETVYDPETEAGKSWYTVYWRDATTVTEVAEKASFAGIKGSVVADFHGIDDVNSKALSEGRPFVARVAVIMTDAGAGAATGVNENNRQVAGWFTPDKGRSPRGGTIEVNGKPVRVALRKQHSRIYVRQKRAPQDLAGGFWKVTVRGKDVEGKFVAESMEVSPMIDPRTVDDPALPRVLVVGDSISMNYHNAAKSALKGVANYYRIDGNSSSTVHGVKNMELWLGDYTKKDLHWDVIQFNHGLHDLKQTHDKTTDTWGEYSVSIEDYKANLEKEIAILRKTGARLIWCTTTPVANSNTGQYARRKGAADLFNRAAVEVMRRHAEIQINDLHGFVCETKAFDKWRTGNDVHFWSEDLQGVLGKAVAGAIADALDRRTSTPVLHQCCIESIRR